MSYILDALKKSEKERQQEQGPNLHSLHGSIPGFQKSPSKKKTRVLLWSFYTIVLALVLGASYYAYRQEFWTDRSLEATIHSPQKEGLSSSPSSAQTTTETTAPPLSISQDKKKIVRRQETFTARSPSVIQGQATSKVQILPTAQDLPAEIQKHIPEITLAGHTYSETPKQRMVVLNSKILREGDKVNTNIKLIEITWEGVILDYNGTRFQKNTK